jgi:hypothetical protein
LVFLQSDDRKIKRDQDLCLNTESGDTTNDPKKGAGQFVKAFQSKAKRLRRQSGPITIPRYIYIYIYIYISDKGYFNEIHNLGNKK